MAVLAEAESKFLQVCFAKPLTECRHRLRHPFVHRVAVVAEYSNDLTAATWEPYGQGASPRI
ncbi:MAG TPA: hypothetical protein VFW33_13785, partial [Gemmataceae bacterium]|nr:hypothetical protein [Gemmataceae bacterium]